MAKRSNNISVFGSLKYWSSVNLDRGWLMEPKDELIDRKLEELRSVPGVEGCALVTVGGLPISSSLPGKVPEEEVAAMCAAALNVAKKINSGLYRGDFEMEIVKGSRGYAILMNVDTETLLVTLTDKDALLGQVFIEARRIARELAEALA